MNSFVYAESVYPINIDPMLTLGDLTVPGRILATKSRLHSVLIL